MPDIATRTARAHLSGIWQDAVPLFRLDIPLDTANSSQYALALRTSTSKRRHCETHPERAAKIPRLTSGQSLTETAIASISEDGAGDDDKSSSWKRWPVSISSSSRGGAVGPLAANQNNPFSNTFRIKIEDETANLLCTLEARSQSSSEVHIVNSILRFLNASDAMTCKTVAYLAVEIEKRLEVSAITLQLELCWRNSNNFDDTPMTTKKHSWADTCLLSSALFAAQRSVTDEHPTLRMFYDNVFTPIHTSESSKDIEVPGLRTGLYAFQARTVDWLLRREHFDSGNSIPYSDIDDSVMNGFVEISDVNGGKCYFNKWLTLCTTDSELLEPATNRLHGGILAEEMGLGKTVEIISLVQLHKRFNLNQGSVNQLRSISATLIITPKSIIDQWTEEINTHAPTLQVMIYTGMKAQNGNARLDDVELIELFQAHDIVLVTYEVLASEIHYATDPPERNMRHRPVYERRKSPLVQVDWWRVVLDEAQMVESGVTKAAQVAVQIPRTNAWAVTGTPLKKSLNDLYGLLLFLRLSPYCLSISLWSSLTCSFPSVFKQLVRSICLRHSKEQVRAELHLPPQKRIVITVPFTAIEEQNYSQLFEEMITDCGLDALGLPVPDVEARDSSRIVAAMRSWLARLRQICLHPEVGDRNRKAMGARGPLRTVADVLHVMSEQNESALRAEERARLQSLLRRGQILEQANDPNAAMSIWKEVEKEAILGTEVDRKAIADLESEDLVRRRTLSDRRMYDDDIAARASRLKNRLRSSLEMKHTAVFFIANALYQIKSDTNLTAKDSDEFRSLEEQESGKYEEAKQLRRELLAGAAVRTKNLIDKVTTRRMNDDFGIPMFRETEVEGGLQSSQYIRILELIKKTLNLQTEYISKWRSKIIEAACAPLVDQEETELTGEEYENSTRQEDRIHAYMEAFKLLVADRSQVLTGQKNMNVRRDAANILRSAIAGQGHAPELMKTLLLECDRIRLAETQQGDIEACVRGLIHQLNHKWSLLTDPGRNSTRQPAEKLIFDRLIAQTRSQAAEQQRAVVTLEKDIELFSDTVNARVEYYKQLQELSDLVAPFEETLTSNERLSRLNTMASYEEQSMKKIGRLRSRSKYLEHLRIDSRSDRSERKCIICQEAFESGCLTTCGHIYCKDCIVLWWRQHRSCPTCKASISRSDLFPITYKPLNLTVQEQDHDSDIAIASDQQRSRMADASIYEGINQRHLDEIRSIDLPGSYGTKIDMLARHLLWIRENDPGAKAVVFTQFRDFLEILGHAFDRFRIGWSSIESGPQGIERFKREPRIECLFLHAKAQSSGLNLVNATHVFICEPLINPSVELQAIARVHRIGQHSTTTVWMYLIENTVEKAIYEISAERRMAHINALPTNLRGKGSRLANGLVRDSNLEDEIDTANSYALEEAPSLSRLASGRGGGEQVAKEDVWLCLFRHRPLLHGPQGVSDARHQMSVPLQTETV